MDLLEQPAPAAAAAPEPTDDALLGLPPGVSAPHVAESDGSYAAAAAAAAAAAVPAAAHKIQWYHLDPNEHYEELRLGEGPGLWRGLAFGGLLSLLAVGAFYACMWFVEPSAALLNPFIDRSYSEARDDLAVHLGGLSPVPLSNASTAAGAGAGAAPTTQRATPKFEIADLRSAHRPAAGGDSNRGTTWYRFDLPREQVPLYRQHLVRTWLDHLKHRVEDGGNDDAFARTGAPPFWDAAEFDLGTRVRLMRANGDVAFHAAFCASRGRVYVRVNH